MLKIVFMGTPSFSVPILEALIAKYQVIGVVTQPDKIVGRKKELVFSPVKQCALKHGIKVFQPIKIRTDYQEIVDLAPDLIVTAAYGQIVGIKLLNAPKYRSINVHGSLLPQYRGGAPIQYSIKNGDKFTGVTIMYMEKAMDSGDILAQRVIPIGDDETSGDLFEKMSLVGRDLLLETIEPLINNQITPIKQDESLVTFAYNILPSEEEITKEFDATKAYNLIRALLPSPVANFNLGTTLSDKIKIYQAKVSTQTHNQQPGTIVGYHKEYFTIALANHSCLDIYQLAPFGKRIMKASEFINGGLKKYLFKERETV